MTTINVEKIEIGPIATNSYLVWPEGENACWIIDPGGLPKPIISAVERNGLEPEMIIITHGHWDHFLGNRCLKGRWPEVPIAVHEADAEALPNPNVNLSVSMFGKLIKSPPADRLLHEGDKLRLGEFEFEVIHTPGHSPGGICLYCSDKQIAFVGDLIFAGGGVGRTDLPRASTDQLYNSIDKFFKRVANETVIYPGHGEATRADRERVMLI